MILRLAYPDVPPPKIYEIFKQSLRQPIHAYGIYVNPVELYIRMRGHSQPCDASIIADASRFLWNIRQELIAVGLHSLSIASIPIPKKLRKSSSGDESWVVILGTGFNKTPHTPISDELVKRVQGILGTEDKPAWWLMKAFNYPPPKPWIDFYKENPVQRPEGSDSSGI